MQKPGFWDDQAKAAEISARACPRAAAAGGLPVT